MGSVYPDPSLASPQISRCQSIEGLKYELLTDGDFTKAKDDIKALKDAEKTISAVDQEIVNGSADIKAPPPIFTPVPPWRIASITHQRKTGG